MYKRLLFFIFVGVLAGVHVGTVRRTDDPIRNAQTDGIAYQQKMEEEKDGVKGPSSYSVKYNPDDTFFIDPPFDSKEKSAAKKNVRPERPSDLSDWWEEKPVQGPGTSSDEEITEKAGLVEGTEASVGASAEMPGEGAGSESKTQSEDYWW